MCLPSAGFFSFERDPEPSSGLVGLAPLLCLVRIRFDRYTTGLQAVQGGTVRKNLGVLTLLVLLVPRIGAEAFSHAHRGRTEVVILPDLRLKVITREKSINFSRYMRTSSR